MQHKIFILLGLFALFNICLSQEEEAQVIFPLNPEDRIDEQKDTPQQAFEKMRKLMKGSLHKQEEEETLIEANEYLEKLTKQFGHKIHYRDPEVEELLKKKASKKDL